MAFRTWGVGWPGSAVASAVATPLYTRPSPEAETEQNSACDAPSGVVPVANSGRFDVLFRLAVDARLHPIRLVALGVQGGRTQR